MNFTKTELILDSTINDRERIGCLKTCFNQLINEGEGLVISQLK